METKAPDMSAVKERMRKVWTSGEYARIGNPLVLIGERLCEAADLRSGEKVLDVATGSGNTAISAARRFCEVTGMDLAEEWLEHARKRAEAPFPASGRTARPVPGTPKPETGAREADRPPTRGSAARPVPGTPKPETGARQADRPPTRGSAARPASGTSA